MTELQQLPSADQAAPRTHAEFMLDEAKWLFERSMGTNFHVDCLKNYMKAREHYVQAVYGPRAVLITKLLEADEDTLAQFKLFLGGDY